MNHHDDLNPVRINRQWKNQKGMTAVGIAVILGMIGFFALIALRLFPIYMEHFNVTTHLENLATDGKMKDKTNAQILEKLKRSFQIDDIENVKRDHIYIEREKGGGLKVVIEYEVRTVGIGNVDMVAKFSDEVKLN